MSITRALLFIATAGLVSSVRAESASTIVRQQEWTRLSQASSRDDVTAAIWIAMPTESGGALPDGFDAVEHRAAERFAKDPQVLFALAAVCQHVEHHCTDARYHDALVRIEPQNAVNWLLLPDHAAPDAASLHSAASAQFADSNLRTTLRVVRAALEKSGGDTRAAVDDIAANVPLPEFRGFAGLCKTSAAAPVGDCVAVAKTLVGDRSGALLTRMIGSVTIRRMMKGTPDDLAAQQMRRDYVWLDEHSATLMPDQDRWQESIVRYGEWDAMLRAADTAGVSRTPPVDWKPRDPQSLLMSEERAPAK